MIIMLDSYKIILFQRRHNLFSTHQEPIRNYVENIDLILYLIPRLYVLHFTSQQFINCSLQL